MHSDPDTTAIVIWYVILLVQHDARCFLGEKILMSHPNKKYHVSKC